jgi:hypothetical protein
MISIIDFIITIMVVSIFSILLTKFYMVYMKKYLQCPYKQACMTYHYTETKKVLRNILLLMIDEKIKKEEIVDIVDKEFPKNKKELNL